jgi:hypothetical protein
MPEDTPVSDALAAITAASGTGSELTAREHVIAGLAALVADGCGGKLRRDVGFGGGAGPGGVVGGRQ